MSEITTYNPRLFKNEEKENDIKLKGIKKLNKFVGRLLWMTYPDNPKYLSQFKSSKHQKLF